MCGPLWPASFIWHKVFRVPHPYAMHVVVAGISTLFLLCPNNIPLYACHILFILSLSWWTYELFLLLGHIPIFMSIHEQVFVWHKLLLTCKSSFYILNKSSLKDKRFANLFSHSIDHLTPSQRASCKHRSFEFKRSLINLFCHLCF